MTPSQGRPERIPAQHLVILRAVLAGVEDDHVALLRGIPVEPCRRTVPTTRRPAALVDRLG